jgi:hypothetical protein
MSLEHLLEGSAGLSPSTLDTLQTNLLPHLDVRDRTYHLRTYRECFVGSAAVTAVVSAGLARTREAAVGLLRALERDGRLEHVVREHTFADKEYFYKLTGAGACPEYDLVVVGGGSAGLTAAGFAARMSGRWVSGELFLFFFFFFFFFFFLKKLRSVSPPSYSYGRFEMIGVTYFFHFENARLIVFFPSLLIWPALSIFQKKKTRA